MKKTPRVVPLGAHWKRLKPVKAHATCLNCDAAHELCPLDRKLTVGFGSVEITKDREGVYQDYGHVEWEDADTLATHERMAARDPDHDWRVSFDTPMYDRTYQRQGPRRWVLVKQGMGFA